MSSVPLLRESYLIEFALLCELLGEEYSSGTHSFVWQRGDHLLIVTRTDLGGWSAVVYDKSRHSDVRLREASFPVLLGTVKEMVNG